MLKFEVSAPARSSPTIAAKLVKAKAFAKHVTTKAIVAACKVTPQAVSGWRKTGRIDKKHLAQLAALTGTTLAWWLDGNPDSEPVPADTTYPMPSARELKVEQEILPFHATDPVANRLLEAFAKLTSADQERYLHEIETLAARTQAIFEEMKSRGSHAALAFGTAVKDKEVAEKLGLSDHPKA